MSRKTRPVLKLDAQNRQLNDSEHDETFRGQYTGTNLIFAGFARPGASTASAVWKIFQINYDANDNITSILWPISPDSGAISSDYEFIYDDRAALTFA